MKNSIIITVALVIIATSLLFGFISFIKAPDSLFERDVEALSYCEVTNHGSVKLTCDGDGTCSTTYMGATLVCDGTKVK